VLVVDYYTLNRLQRNVDDVFNLIETFVGGGFATSLLKIKAKVVNAPFRTMLLVIVL
jgi:hypothetical protein